MSTNMDNELELKAARISRRIDERLALEQDLHAVEQAIVLRYIVSTKLLQGDFPLAKQAQVAQQLAKLDAALAELGAVLDAVREESKATPAPMTLEQSIELAHAAHAADAVDDEPDILRECGD